MPNEVIRIIAIAIIIATIIGLIRYRRIDKVYYPFIYLCWLAATVEIITFFELVPPANIVYLHNTYSIGEYSLISWQMYRWRVISLRALRYILAGLSLAWFIEFVVFDRFNLGANYFNIIYAVVIMIMSIRCFGWRLMVERGSLLQSSYMIICSAFILYFTTAAIVSAFWMYGMYGSLEFVKAVVVFHYIVNLIANLAYAIAVLCMPRKEPFTLPY